MIIVKFTSGLGNQMFQYSLYSLLREKFPHTAVKADVTWFGRSSEHQGYELKRIFQREDNPDFSIQEASPFEILRCTGRYPNPHKGRLGDLWQSILKLPHALIRLTGKEKYARMLIDQSGFEDNREVYERIMSIDPSKDWYISGFFIEEIYYRDRLKTLRKHLSFDTAFGCASGCENRELLSAIESLDSVSIHVRRGDYLSPQYSSSFIALPMEYYKKAVSLVMEEHENPVFFIFSDDKEFIQKEFSWIDELYPSPGGGSRIRIVSGNTGKNSFRDLQLMSRCKTNIIANSTFSVWAGLLNEQENARIYYPKRYMQQKDSEEKTIPGWIRVED